MSVLQLIFFAAHCCCNRNHCSLYCVIVTVVVIIFIVVVPVDVPRRQPHRHSGLATLPFVGAIP